MAHEDQIRDEAIAWAVRSGDPAFTEWDRFTDWLEQDPAHAAAYDRVLANAADAAALLAPGIDAANDDAPAHRGGARRWLGGLIAAAAALAVSIGVWQVNYGSYTVRTAPGETRMIALEDGGTVALAGDSELVLDRSDPRLARLEQGQAEFTIHHDEASPFRVEVGGNTLLDVGTVFDVKHVAGQTTVAVAEGAVQFNPRRQNVRIVPGQMLVTKAGSAEYRIASVPAAQIGEWRSGRLTFNNASLGEVAADLSRATGLAFAAAPDAASRAVSGSLLVAPLRDDPRSLGPLLGVSVERSGESWVLGGR